MWLGTDGRRAAGRGTAGAGSSRGKSQRKSSGQGRGHWGMTRGAVCGLCSPRWAGKMDLWGPLWQAWSLSSPTLDATNIQSFPGPFPSSFPLFSNSFRALQLPSCAPTCLGDTRQLLHQLLLPRGSAVFAGAGQTRRKASHRQLWENRRPLPPTSTGPETGFSSSKTLRLVAAGAQRLPQQPQAGTETAAGAPQSWGRLLSPNSTAITEGCTLGDPSSSSCLLHG